MFARIYQPSRNAMQSGNGNTEAWILEFEPESSRSIDPLMGWTSSSDMRSQVRLTFASKKQAIEYAKDHKIGYQVVEPNKRKPILRKRGYGENFSYNRRESWTH